MTAQDIKSLSELKSLAREKTDEWANAVEDDREALDIEASTGVDSQAVAEAGDDVEQASDGNLAADDYVEARDAPVVSNPNATQFERVFDHTRGQLMFEATTNLNGFTRQALRRGLELADDIDALLSEISAEAGKLSLAAAAGLLVPPRRDEVAELRQTTQEVYDQSTNTTRNLRAAKARRDAARRHLQNDPLVKEAIEDDELKPAGHRFLEPAGEPPPDSSAPDTVNRSYVAASQSAVSLERQAQATGRVDAGLPEATASLQASALDRVGYIAICLAIAGMDRSQTTKNRAQRLFSKLLRLVTAVQDSLGAGFLRNLQGQFQELAADSIDNIALAIQDKLDSFDSWLNLLPKELPTFVSLVEYIGDRPSDTPILEDLAAYCDLNLTAFCDFQGLLEAAKSLDAQIAQFLPQPPTLGRVNLLVNAPPAEDYVPPEPTPDRETDMYLVSISGTRLVARMPYTDVRRLHTTPVPPLPGQLTNDVVIGDLSLEVTGLAPNVAGLGTIIVNPGPLQQVLRYSLHEAGVFTLIDAVESDAGATSSVLVTGEQRDTFTGGFEKNPNISGGLGTLEIGADGESRESRDYNSSSFDEATGEYTFELTSSLDPDRHAFHILCRPMSTRHILFKDQGDLRILAQRFRVVGDEIRHQTISNFDFTSDIDVDDYDNDRYLLIVGLDGMGIELDAVASTPATGMLKLKAGIYYDGDQSNMALSRTSAIRPAGANNVYVRLDERQKKDLLADHLSIGHVSTDLVGRLTVDGGQGSVGVDAETTIITGTDEQQTLTSKEPIVLGDEANMTMEMQSGVSQFTADIDVANAAGQQLTYTARALTGTVEIQAADTKKVLGTGTRFLSEFQIGDHIHVDDTTGERKIATIPDDQTMTLTATMSVVSGKHIFKVAPTSGLSMIRRFTVNRRPREDTLDFNSITNIDDQIHSFGLVGTTDYAHGLQEPEVKPTIRVISGTRSAYLDRIANVADNIRPRFDGQTVPPGSVTVRAELQKPEFSILQSPLVLLATSVWARDRELILSGPVTEDDGVYTLPLADTLIFPLAEGEVIYVETTSLIDQFGITFPDEWTEPFDEFFAQIATLLKEWDRKVCQMLQGRASDLGVTGAALALTIETMRLTILLPMRMTLEMMLAGLQASTIVEDSISIFESSGMDAAAEATREGDISVLAQMTVSTSTNEGRAREAIKQYQLEIKWTADSVRADEVVAALTAQEYDKMRLAEQRRDHKDIAREKMDRRLAAAQAVQDKAESITEA